MYSYNARKYGAGQLKTFTNCSYIYKVFWLKNSFQLAHKVKKEVSQFPTLTQDKHPGHQN